MTNVHLKKSEGEWKVFSDEQKEQLRKGLAILNKVKGVQETYLYFMKDRATSFSTSAKEMYMFLGATPEEHRKIDGVIVKFGTHDYAVEKYEVNTINAKYTTLKNESGDVIAYVDSNRNEIYVPYNLEALEPEQIIEITSYIAELAKTEVFDEIANINSWVRSKQKEELKGRIVAYMKRGQERRMAELKDRVSRGERETRDLQTRLKEAYDILRENRNRFEIESKMDVSGLDNFLKGLDDIASHEKVENVEVHENMITVKTVPLIITARVEGQTKRFKLGRATMNIDIDSSTVTFDSETRRRGYWTGKDPHPHVNGENGHPCLGNVANTIASLASEREIYPLYLTCLSYLETANTEDSAGRKVINWEEVTE